MELAVANCQRAGCINNMKVNEVAEAKKQKEVGNRVILIKNHKTFTTYGSAPMVVTEQLLYSAVSLVEIILYFQA
jgi:hypothetical protein